MQDPYFSFKKALVGDNWHVQHFGVEMNLGVDTMRRFIQFARFVAFNENVEHLVEAKKQAEEAFLASNPNATSTTAVDAFRGFLPIVSVQNEIAAWKLISDMVDKSLAKYPTTLDQDFELLEQKSN